MKMFSSQSGNLFRNQALPIVIALMVGMLLSAATLFFLQRNADALARTQLDIGLGKLQANLSIVTTRNRGMGVALLLGLNEPVLKRSALGKYPLDAPEVLERLNIVRQRFSVEGLYVIDKSGVMVANDTDGKKSTGKNVAFRPYFQQAIRGEESVYMAIGTNSDSRGLYVAAPIRETTRPDSPVIGVVAIKISAEEQLDQMLRETGGEALLLSPQGVVFAATRKEWLLEMTPPYDEHRVEEIRKLKQFGMRFEGKKPSILPFDPRQSILQLEDKRFITASANIDWHDPAGKWTAILLQDSEAWLSQSQKRLIVAGIMLLSLLVGLIVRYQLRKTQHLNDLLQRENTKREHTQRQMMATAEERATVAKISLKLRQAEDFQTLVQTFMRYANRILDVQLGLFYVTDNDQQTLEVIGGFGVPTEENGKKIAFGEGLAGQCAVERKPINLQKPPSGYLHVKSGTGESSPTGILLRPLLLKGKLVGVVEMAAFRHFTEQDEALLSELEPILAANVQLMMHRQAIELEFARQRASEERMNAIVSNVSDGIFGIDLEGNTIFVNPAACVMLGYTEDELIGTPMHATVHHTYPDGNPHPRERCPMYETSLDGKPRHISDDVMWHKDGYPIEIEYNTMPMTNRDGQQIGSVIAFRNITERKQAQTALRDQLDFQQALIDTIPYPVFYKGPDSRFLGVNKAYEDTFDVDRKDLIGKRVLDLEYLPDADRIAYQTEDEGIIAKTETIKREIAMPFADGKMHDTLYFVSGFKRNDGEPGGLVGTFLDVSDRKKIEDLERFNQLSMGREKRIIELKKEINALASENNKPRPYATEDSEEVSVDADQHTLTTPAQNVDTIKQSFAELIQREHLKEVFDGFCEAVGIAAAIIDIQGNVLAASRWQRVCTDFHRVNERSCANCIESDTGLASQLEQGQEFTIYRCKNGMTDCAAPVVVNGHHIANVFIGQFHLKKPDVKFFRKQAKDFGFDAEAYVAAVEAAPIMDEAKLPHILGFLAHFSRLIGSFAVKQCEMEQAKNNILAHSEALRRERLAALSLAEDAEKARARLEQLQSTSDTGNS